MRKCLAVLSLLMGYAVSQGNLLRARQPEDADTPNITAATQEQASTIRSTTRLVQVSVVVTNNKGEAITGLKKEDFVVFDESNLQNIAFFSAEAPAPASPAQPLPKNVFTNRVDLKGQDQGAVTVVLFDSLNTSFKDQAYVREEVIKFLKSLKPQDHVAIYALTTQLLVLHEFTQDASALVNAASQFKPKPMAALQASNPETVDVPTMASNPAWQAFQASVNGANARMAEVSKTNRAETTTQAFTIIANHVAAIQGRKNLVWVSGSFPLRISMGVPSGRDAKLQELAKQAARALNRANMAVYPVDATGVVTDPAFAADRVSDKGAPNQAPNQSSLKDSRLGNLDAERILASATGGQAFYGSNDIVAAMRKAFDDGRYSYTIGFYPNHRQWDGKYRRIVIRTSVGGAQLRYRTGYFAEAEGVDTDGVRAQAAMEEAAMSPLDSTGLGIIVSAKLASPAADRKIVLRIGLDPKQLMMQDTEGRQKSSMDLYFVQRDDQGQTIAVGNVIFQDQSTT